MQPDKRGAADDLPAPEGSEGHASAERDVALASLGRIKAAAESDAAFDTLGGLRHFLIHECMAATEALKGTKG